MQIAIMELREKKIPFTVRRYLPDGRYVPMHFMQYTHVVLTLMASCTAGTCSNVMTSVDSVVKDMCPCSYEDWSVQELIVSER